MIITVTGPKKSVRLVVHEDCALVRLRLMLIDWLVAFVFGVALACAIFFSL